jgi:aminopeptidase N
MFFHVPKGLDLLATGTKVNQVNEGKETTTEWKTDVPLPVIGFNLGQFAMKEATVSQPGGDNLTIDAYANSQPPDSFNMISESASESGTSAIGTLGTKGMLPVALSQAQVASQIYTNYFGPLPFSKVAVTQQFACNYGQSWPMLVYLPICGFLDATQQHELGLRPEDMYWKVVTPHEVAHQWWGQTVGFKSYRDQWMSEGFANASAAIFLLSTRPKPDDYLEFWKQQQRLIVEKDAEGFRPIDVGPVTMGFRLNSQKAGQGVYQDIVYTKGAFIPHMIQMMMWNPREGDAQFKAMMQDFVSSYKLQPATTEDFKAMVEKHMTPGMNMDGNGKMDWFFNEYVYGTELPAYHFEGSASETAQGNSVQIKLVQSGVSANFKALVPVYLELADGHIVRMAQMRMVGDTSYEHTFDIPKLAAPIKKVLINYYYDLLCVYN